MQEKLKSPNLLKLALAVAVLIVYMPLFNGFFIQDEWLVFGNFFGNGPKNFFELVSNSFAINVGHYVPFTLLTTSIFAATFKLNYIPYAAFSLTLHLLMVYLVYLLSNKLIKDRVLAFLVAVLFGSAAAGYQATGWVVADINTHGASIFGILSLLSFFKFLQEKKRKFFYFSIGGLVVSLLFKEITAGLFLLLPFTYYFFLQKQQLRKHLFPLIVILVGILYIGFRASMFLLPNQEASVVTQSQSPEYLAYNLLTFPAKGIAQAILPPGVLIGAAQTVASYLPESKGQRGTKEYDIFVEEKILEPILFAVFLIITVITFTIWWRNKKDLWAKIAIFGLVFTTVNSFIFALSPERSGIISVIDSRNLYFVSIGTALLMVALIARITSGKLFKMLVLLVPILLLNVFWLNKELQILAENGSVRKNILNEIKSNNLKLPDKVIFYTESDRSFYGLPEEERILPFQSGFGQTLLVWYQSMEHFPKEFFENKFLWDIKSQGYKETNGRGFGYFRNFEELSKTVKYNQLSSASVIAFRYDSEKQTIMDTTEEVRGRLEGYLAEKREVPRQIIILSSSQNPKDLQNAKDGNRSTAWDSKLPYKHPQSITIELPTFLVIAQIQINSYNNKDQNEVGYGVSISDNGNDWKQVFYEKRYPPGKDGIVNLYIRPQPAKFIKVEQVGYHQFASWVIHELILYEVFK